MPHTNCQRPECGLPLSDESDGIGATWCQWCEDRRCPYCGEYVYPQDQYKGPDKPIHPHHTECMELIKDHENAEPASWGS